MSPPSMKVPVFGADIAPMISGPATMPRRTAALPFVTSLPGPSAHR
jgi:hypothetical protein